MRGDDLWLGVDTASQWISIALMRGPAVLEETAWLDERYRTQSLAPVVQACLNRQNIPVSSLAHIALAIGPGSYTGLRIGLSWAKGIALAGETRIHAVPTLDPLAYAFGRRDRPLWAVLNAGRGRLVAACYPAWAGFLEGDGRPGDWPNMSSLKPARAEDILAGASDLEPQKGDWFAGELDDQQQALFLSAGLQPAAGPLHTRRAVWLIEAARSEYIGADKKTGISLADPDALDALSPIYLAPSG